MNKKAFTVLAMAILAALSLSLSGCRESAAGINGGSSEGISTTNTSTTDSARVHSPEPVSAALFLLGGGALALRRFRKHNKKV